MSSGQNNGTLVWLRRDLRLRDNSAIGAAIAHGAPVHLAFVFDTDILDPLPRSDRRVEFIHQATGALDVALRELGGQLHVLHGQPTHLIPKLAKKLGVERVVCARDYEPAAISRDQSVSEQLRTQDVAFEQVRDHVIFEQDNLLTGAGKPYTVFTPYKKKWLATVKTSQFDAIEYQFGKLLGKPTSAKKFPTLKSLGFEKTNLRDLGIQGSEQTANELLDDFAKRIGGYTEARNFPAVRGVSYLSVHLRFGTLSIRAAAHAAQAIIKAGKTNSEGAQTWLSELIWRDFYFQILHHFPHVADRSFRAEYDRIKWIDDATLFDAWCKGKTGYPLVDAAMAQINQTGYMHNRLRMVVASFLTKDLGIDWRLGEQYFAKHLNDFDLSANNGGWQWASSSGCDAQPYFRIFNPVTQSERFDAKGKFIRKYLPQLANLPDKKIHSPWTADPQTLSEAGITLGQDYPYPLVDHAQARQETLARYAVVKGQQ